MRGSPPSTRSDVSTAPALPRRRAGLGVDAGTYRGSGPSSEAGEQLDRGAARVLDVMWILGTPANLRSWLASRPLWPTIDATSHRLPSALSCWAVTGQRPDYVGGQLRSDRKPATVTGPRRVPTRRAARTQTERTYWRSSPGTARRRPHPTRIRRGACTSWTPTSHWAT